MIVVPVDDNDVVDFATLVEGAAAVEAHAEGPSLIFLNTFEFTFSRAEINFKASFATFPFFIAKAYA